MVRRGLGEVESQRQQHFRMGSDMRLREHHGVCDRAEFRYKLNLLRLLAFLQVKSLLLTCNLRD